ncbi:MAG TPA: AmmeMemoRadiSam system protein A, partial [Minicystis sp.]|nr:AmmeMemoRadiSam system protein A [Minicystis sp.]
YARDAIAEALGGPRATRPVGTWTEVFGATFVTLRRDGMLHGCIGTIEARRPLADDVGLNAVSAALLDPRAPPIDLDDLADLSLELSVLSALSPIAFADEPSAIAALEPGVDGVVIRVAGRQGTFLPQVWRELPDPVDFFTELKMKAGLPSDYWSPDVRLFRYTLHKWSDPPRRVAAAGADLA